MVFKGHDKSEESSGMMSKTQTSKFLAKTRSGNSQYASTNSSMGGIEYGRNTEDDIHHEFLRLYTQLEILREKNMRLGNRHLAWKISAMQTAASRYDVEQTETSAKQNCKLNSMLCVVTDKLVCAAMSPPKESDEDDDSPTDRRHSVTFAQIKDKTCEVTVTIDSSECVEKELAEETAHSIDSPMELQEDSSEGGSGSGTDRNGRPLKSGHAKTHAIVINLDDKSRFTDEVAV